MRFKRTAILISGRGSNMMSLITAAKAQDFPSEICLVVSNNPQAEGLKKAAAEGVKTAAVDHKSFETRQAFEAEIQELLEDAQIELVCLAGFMRLMTEGFVNTWRNRMINIHPSLLPAYKGLDTHLRVIRDGGRMTGCTVHFVRPLMDQGPIIAQAAVGILANDTPDTLAARVLEAEHQIYPMALKLMAEETVRVTGEKVRFDGRETIKPALIAPAMLA